MKKILLPVVLAMLGTSLFTSCSNDESLVVDKVNNYEENFEKVFGQVSPSQNFNTLKTVTIESSVANSQGNYTLRVYDGVPSRKGASLIGKFENLNAGGTSTVKVDASKSAKNIYCVADNGEVRTAVSAPVSSSARVTAKFDTADGAPTNGQDYTDDQLSTVTIAFEDLGSTDDFDFNDAVVKVEYATGTGVANVTLMAVGAVLPLKLYYAGGRNGNVPLFDGQELHAAMGAQDVHTIINTNWKTAQGIVGADNVPFVTCEIEVPEDFTIGEDGAPLILEVNGTQEQRQITASTEYGAVPQVLVTGKYYDEQARTSYFWRWPKERVRLNLAFPTVSGWMSDPTNLTFLAAGVESNLYNGYDPTVVDEQQQPTTGTPAGLEAVDLGLPSGTLWANMNVGATSPEDYGGYYAWGETEEKDVYNWSNYIHYDGGTCHDLGDIAGTEYDVAHVKWGGNWQMPTVGQIQELLDNTISEWVQVNGVNGYRFTSIASGNSNSIFLPAAGFKGSARFYDEDTRYWSSTQDFNSCAFELDFNSSNVTVGEPYRCEGQNVRPVIKGQANLTLSYTNVTVAPGKNKTVKITSGSGQFDLTNQNNSNAEATLSGTTITINGLAEGEAKVVVTDMQTGQQVTIEITVIGPHAPENLEAVDLGLPSGTLWANMNVGADSPEDYGGYYAWGETEEKDVYNWRSYIHNDGTDCLDLSEIAGTEYDVAHVKWGSDWQMPTDAQIQELLDNTTSEWTQVKGVNGYRFTSKATGNSNSIFLPAAGYHYRANLDYEGGYGYYWSSAQSPYYNSLAYYLYFNSGGADWSGWGSRYLGQSVRPVRVQN